MIFQQIDQTHSEGARKRLEHEHSRVGTSILDEADGGLIDARLGGQLLLGQATLPSQPLQIGSKRLNRLRVSERKSFFEAGRRHLVMIGLC